MASEHESSRRGSAALAEGIRIEKERAMNPHPSAIKPRAGTDESSNNGVKAWSDADAQEAKRRHTRDGK